MRLILALAALLLVQSVGFLWHRGFYIDVDGALAITQIRTSVPGALPAALQARISPLQGVGSPAYPLTPWLNPGYAVLLPGVGLPLLLASYLVCSASLFLAVAWLGAALRAGATRSLLAAQAACLLVFHPLEISCGLYPQLRLNPGIVVYVAVAIVLIALLIRGGSRGAAGNVALAAAPVALFLYSLLCDPVWTAVPYFSLWVFFVAALLVDRGRTTDLWRGGALLGGLAVLAALSVPAYLTTLLGDSARARFRTEIIGVVQDRFYAFLPFHNTRTAVLFVVLLAGAAAALADGERRVRLFAAASLVHMAFLTGLSLVYLYTDVNWTYPLPAYLQLPGLPVSVLVAAVGWHALARRAGAAAGLSPGNPKPAAAVFAVPLIGLALIGAKGLGEGRPVAEIWNTATDYSNGFRLSHPHLLELERQLAVPPGQAFRGSVVTVYPEADAENAHFLLSRFAAMGIPALEEYSQLVSPQQYYLVTRALGQPSDGPSSRNRLRVTVPRVALLRAMGVRYVWAWPGQAALLDAAPEGTVVGVRDLLLHRLYELRDPNLGTYSPVNVRTSRSARETVALLVSPAMDFERDVVLAEPIAGPLVPAREAALRFEEGGVRVTARSDGRSLLLLPVQYSHALHARAVRGGAQLLRANLTQTGLLFEREVDAFISLRFGLGRTAGKARDLADLEALGIGEDGTRVVPPEVRERLHPFARVRL
jgi:hypothetical protein